MYKVFTLAAAVLASAGAQAHSGHHQGALAETLAHIWTHADHWLPAVALLSVTVAGIARLRLRTAARRCGQQHGE